MCYYTLPPSSFKRYFEQHPERLEKRCIMRRWGDCLSLSAETMLPVVSHSQLLCSLFGAFICALKCVVVHAEHGTPYITLCMVAGTPKKLCLR